MNDLTTIDLVLIALIGIGAISGFVKGLLKQVATIFGLVAGLFIAKALYLSLAEQLSPAITDSMTVAQVVAFISIWLLVPFVCVLIASLLGKMLNAISLGWINHLLGLAAGAVICVVVLSLVLNIIDFIDPEHSLISETKKQSSVLYYPIKNFVSYIFPAAGEAAGKYILT